METSNNTSEAKDRADKLWGLANALTGFSVAQAIALILTLVSSKDFVKHVQSAKFPTAALVILGVLLYGIPLWRCWIKEIQARLIFSSKDKTIFDGSTVDSG